MKADNLADAPVAITDADLVEIKRRLAADLPIGHTRMWSAELVAALVAEIEALRAANRSLMERNGSLRDEVAKLQGVIIEVVKLQDQLDTAHRGLRRALDFRTASPDGLDIKEDVRDALRRSGCPGPWGYVGDRY